MPRYKDYCQYLKASITIIHSKQWMWKDSDVFWTISPYTIIVYNQKQRDALFDKLYKWCPLLQHLLENFLSVFQHSEEQSIDESLVRFKGYSSLKQNMPKNL